MRQLEPMLDHRFNTKSRSNGPAIDPNCFIYNLEAFVSHETNPTLNDKLGNDLLHDLGCPATDGQHPVISI